MDTFKSNRNDNGIFKDVVIKGTKKHGPKEWKEAAAREKSLFLIISGFHPSIIPVVSPSGNGASTPRKKRYQDHLHLRHKKAYN